MMTEHDRAMVTLGPIKRTDGIAGQVAYSVTATYPGEEPKLVTFVGNRYAGPVVMVIGDVQTFVTKPSRFGSFTTRWVRRFFADDPVTYS